MGAVGAVGAVGAAWLLRLLHVRRHGRHGARWRVVRGRSDLENLLGGERACVCACMNVCVQWTGWAMTEAVSDVE